MKAEKAMKDIINAPFLKEFTKTTSNMYRLGWDERNGGNISYLLDEEEIRDYEISKVKREIPLGFNARELIGRYFLMTGTGKYFKNCEDDPQSNLGIIRIKNDGITAELMWGFADGGTFTSETPAHLMSHIARLSVDPHNRVVLHSHPQNIMAMTFIHPIDDREFTRTIWKMNNECIIVFPDGIGTLPWMVCGTNEIGEATAEKMKQYRIVVWPNHGIYGVGRTLDEAFGLVETVEKAAMIYNIIGERKIINPITDKDLKELAEYFKVDYRRDFLDL